MIFHQPHSLLEAIFAEKVTCVSGERVNDPSPTEIPFKMMSEFLYLEHYAVIPSTLQRHILKLWYRFCLLGRECTSPT